MVVFNQVWGFFSMTLVKFKIDKNLDKQVAIEFVGLDFGGVNFSEGIFDVHPRLRELKNVHDKKLIKEQVSEYFDSYYHDHTAELEERTGEFQKEWGGVEEEFLNLTNRIFKNHPLPKGKYIGYLSIINCNPRFLEEKTFQVFYQHPKGVKYVTIHELLHFLFYDYAIKNLPEIFAGLDTEGGVFWDLAEIFNSIVMVEPRFEKLHEQKEVDVYPKHQNYLSKLTKLWEETQDIGEWLAKGYELIK